MSNLECRSKPADTERYVAKTPDHALPRLDSLSQSFTESPSAIDSMVTRHSSGGVETDRERTTKSEIKTNGAVGRLVRNTFQISDVNVNVDRPALRTQSNGAMTRATENHRKSNGVANGVMNGAKATNGAVNGSVGQSSTSSASRSGRLESLTYVQTTEFDNENGDLIYSKNDVFDDVDHRRRYRVMSKIGSGTFGQVVKVELLTESSHDEYDEKANDDTSSHRETFAIKIIKNKEAYHVQALKETAILQKLNSRWDPHGHHNIVRLLSVFYDKGHLMLVFPVLSWNLYELLRAHQHRGFKTSVVKVFVEQVTSALICLAKAGIVHTDLKPENILLESSDRWKIKVIDFGSAAYENHSASTYIQSRFYRAPEVILCVGYNRAIDMWSLGCIAAELFVGLPLFPGKNEFNQLTRITKVLKQIPDYVLEQGARTEVFYEAGIQEETGAKTYRMKSVEEWARENSTDPVPITEYFAGGSLEEIIMARNLSATTDPRILRHEHQERILLVDFIRKCLEFDFARRMTPIQAAKHAFLSRGPTDLRTPNGVVDGATTPGGRLGMNGSGGGLHQSARHQTALQRRAMRVLQTRAAQNGSSQQQSIRNRGSVSAYFPPASGGQDMRNVIAARNKQGGGQRWRHKSYDVGQHMRAEAQARRRQQEPPRFASFHPSGGVAQSRSQPQRQPQPQPQPSGVSQPHRLKLRQQTQRPQQGGQSSRLTGLSVPMMHRSQPVSMRRDFRPNVNANPQLSQHQMISQLQQLRSIKRHERRRMPQESQGGSPSINIAPQPRAEPPKPPPPQPMWAHRSMSDLTQLADNHSNENETPRRVAYNGMVPRQVSDSTLSTLAYRRRSNTVPDMPDSMVAPPLVDLSVTSASNWGPVSQAQAPPPGSYNQGRFAGPARPIHPHQNPMPPNDVTGQPGPFPPFPSQHGQTDAAVPNDQYAQYMHEYISARGQQQNHEMGEAARAVRTWQTPRTRYF